MLKDHLRDLKVHSKQIANGISIEVGGKEFKIEYPEGVWQKTPPSVRQVLLENLTFGHTHFLSLIFKKEVMEFDMPMPFFEAHFFKNHLCDLIDTERVDKAPFLSYVKRFYNTDYRFRKGDSAFPDVTEIPRFRNKTPTAIIPFTFGKESLVTLALCQELGIKPILIYCQDPIEQYEEAFKLKWLKEFEKKFGVQTYFVKNDPGMLRCGAAFGQETDIGWGVQVTLLALTCVPFIFAHQAEMMLFGSEYSNNEFEYIDGWRLSHSYDQTPSWTRHKNNMIRALTNNQCSVRASLEPLEEPDIFYILHHRYPELGKYQFSCRAEKPLFEDSQWCHECYKCARMFLFARTFEVDPHQIGFKKDLLTEKMFGDYFGSDLESGSMQDLDFSFYAIYKKKRFTNRLIELFAEKKVSQMKPWNFYVDHFTKIHPNENLPPLYENKMLSIFEKELDDLKNWFLSN